MNPLIRSLRRSSRFQAIVVALLLPGIGAVSLPVRANPSGGVVTHGGVHIGEALNGHLMINQLSDKAIINWEDFSIGAGEITQFLQPGAQSGCFGQSQRDSRGSQGQREGHGDQSQWHSRRGERIH